MPKKKGCRLAMRALAMLPESEHLPNGDTDAAPTTIQKIGACSSVRFPDLTADVTDD
jgi:hypothetical protein